MKAKAAGVLALTLVCALNTASFAGDKSITSPKETGATKPAKRKGNWKPEVVIPGADKKKVIEALMAAMTDRKYAPTSGTDYSLVFEREAGAAASILSGALMGRNLTSPVYRITYSVFDVADSVRVAADIALIQNPGTAFQRRTDMNSGKDRDNLQAFLESISTQTARPTQAPDTSATPAPQQPDSNAAKK